MDRSARRSGAPFFPKTALAPRRVELRAPRDEERIRERCGLSSDEPLAQRRRFAAPVARRREGAHLVGDVAQSSHRRERLGPEIAIEPGRDYVSALLMQRREHVCELGREEMRLVHEDDLRVPGRLSDLHRIVRLEGTAGSSGMTDDPATTGARVTTRLDEDVRDTFERRPLLRVEERLGLPAEHRPADDDERLLRECDHAGNYCDPQPS